MGVHKHDKPRMSYYLETYHLPLTGERKNKLIKFL